MYFDSVLDGMMCSCSESDRMISMMRAWKVCSGAPTLFVVTRYVGDKELGLWLAPKTLGFGRRSRRD